MKNHHAANVTLEGRPLIITLCEACSSASAFVPIVNGERLLFQVAGVYRGTWLMEDQQTHSYWGPFTGDCLSGHYIGVEMERYPLFQSTWSDWLLQHPDSLVLPGDGEPRDGHGSGSDPGTYNPGMMRTTTLDPRLEPNLLVLGVDDGKLARAYTLDDLHRVGAPVNDDLRGSPIVIFFVPDTLLALAFSRQIDGQILTFDAAGRDRFRDRETGSEWNIDGIALSGPSSGRRLKFVPSKLDEWYIFAASHGGSAVEIYQPVVESMRG